MADSARTYTFTSINVDTLSSISGQLADPDSTARRRGAKPRSTRISLNFRFKSAVHVTRPTLYKLLRDHGLMT